MKFHSFCLLLLLLTCTCNLAEGLWGSKKTDQQQANDLGHKAAEDAKLSAKYARDAAADTIEAAKAQGRAFTKGAKQRAQDYYDSAGNVIGNLRGYAGTVYDRTGNALGDAKDFVCEQAHDYYDSAGNLIDNLKGYAGTVYDQTGNALGDAKDYVYDTASEYYDKAGNLIDNIRDYFGTVYDRAGNALGDAKDFAYEKAHDYYDSTGNAIGNIRDYVGTVYDRAGNALGDAKDFVTGSARRKASIYYDKAGNVVSNIRGYTGTLYDKAGNALGDAKDFAFDRAHDYYDNAGNVIDNIRGFAGTVYDKAGNALGDAKDFANEKASEKLHRAGDYFQYRPADRHGPCRRLVSDSCECVKSFFPTTFLSLLLTLAALAAASYFIYTRMLGKRLDAEDLKRQTRQIGNTIKAKAGEAREKVNELGHRAKETIGTKLNNGRTNGHDEGFQEEETTHEYNLRTNVRPVVHYSDDQWTAKNTQGHAENPAEMMEGEDGVLLENK